MYLSRTGYKGLYRLNKQGQYNTSYGYHSHHICDIPEIWRMHLILRKATLACVDFEKAVTEATDGDVVYLDPPYIHTYHTHYTASGFQWDDCRRLQQVCYRLARRKVTVLVSNIDTPLIRQLFLDINFHIYTIRTRRTLGKRPQHQHETTEIIATNISPDIVTTNCTPSLIDMCTET